MLLKEAFLLIIIIYNFYYVRNKFRMEKGTRLFPAAANQFNDLMPMIKNIGLKDAGATYESLTALIPLSVFGTMAYDIIKNKNQFYFTPVFKNNKFGRNMYVFS